MTSLMSPNPMHSEPTGATLRWLAVPLLVAAGILHLAQVGVHLAEGWHVAGFFVAVGIAQVAGGLWLLRPTRPIWVWVGIIGSAAVIVVWIVSRTSGLPFVEGGEPEPLGIADAFASLIEAITMAALGLHLVACRRRLPAGIRAVATTVVLALALAWQVAAGAGAFNADDTRLALDQPQLIDWLVLALAVSVAATFQLAAPPVTAPALAGLRRGLLAVTGLLALSGVTLTLPPTIGQNIDCAYAPLATVTGVGHGEEPLIVDIPPGETRLISAFELRVCGPDRVELLDAEPLTTIGDASQIVGFWLVPLGSPGDGTAFPSPPPAAVRVPPGGVVSSGQRLAVEVRGVAGAAFQLASIRLTYRTDGGGGSFGFATSVVTCSGSGCSDGEQP
jgi:hypothetical protein